MNRTRGGVSTTIPQRFTCHTRVDGASPDAPVPSLHSIRAEGTDLQRKDDYDRLIASFYKGN